MNDLNTLMSRMEEINTKSATDLTPPDIDIIIAYHRAQRARRQSGEKTLKPKIDLSSIMNKVIKKPEIKPINTTGRRF